MKFKPFNIMEVLDEMNFNCENPKFTVYVHTSPYGKKYVGITSQIPEKRWGYNGNGYVDNKHFYSAICLYGWENFKHEIIAENLDLVEASNLESSLISKFDAMNPNHGYNQTTGGNWSKPSLEVREKLRKATTERWKDPAFRNKVIPPMQASLSGRKLSEEHKQHIKQYWDTHEHPLKGTHLSEAQKLKLSASHKGMPSWSKGFTKETHPSLMKTSASLTGRKFSDETKERMRKSKLNLYLSGYEPRWINNGVSEKQITSEEELPSGYHYGRLDSLYVTNGVDTRKIKPEDLDDYISQGWRRGKSQETYDRIKKSRQQFVWEYDGHEFVSAVELAKYLNDHGYPKIVGSTITNLYLKGFSTSKIYESLDGKIHRSEVNES